MRGEATRMEEDSMGEMSVPASALYGASTQRAVLNFPISGYRFSRPFIRALGLIKWAAAQANHDLGLLDAERSALIVQAAEEVADGKLEEHFPLDIFQTGSGTSTNTALAKRWKCATAPACAEKPAAAPCALPIAARSMNATLPAAGATPGA